MNKIHNIKPYLIFSLICFFYYLILSLVYILTYVYIPNFDSFVYIPFLIFLINEIFSFTKTLSRIILKKQSQKAKKTSTYGFIFLIIFVIFISYFYNKIKEINNTKPIIKANITTKEVEQVKNEFITSSSNDYKYISKIESIDCDSIKKNITKNCQNGDIAVTLQQSSNCKTIFLLRKENGNWEKIIKIESGCFEY